MGPVGILCLQGDYQRHAEMLDALAMPWCEVRRVADLERCAALILPGGESTAITQLLQSQELFEPLRRFAQSHPIMGTCAGLVLMGITADARVRSLEVLDIHVARNAYGRQAQSFQQVIEMDLGQGREDFPAVFIRAPRVTEVGPSVTILARHNGSPVLVAQGRHLGMSFHPELTEDMRIHRYWLERLADRQDHVLKREACA